MRGEKYEHKDQKISDVTEIMERSAYILQPLTDNTVS